MRLASHTHGSVIPWNTLNFMLIISTLDFPVMIEIKSTGPATREHPYSVGKKFISVISDTSRTDFSQPSLSRHLASSWRRAPASPGGDQTRA